MLFDEVVVHKGYFYKCRFLSQLNDKIYYTYYRNNIISITDKIILHYCDLTNLPQNIHFANYGSYDKSYLIEILEGCTGFNDAAPKEGEFIAYKKVIIIKLSFDEEEDYVYKEKLGEAVIKLKIPAEAKRVSSFSNKIRVSEAYVEEVVCEPKLVNISNLEVYLGKDGANSFVHRENIEEFYKRDDIKLCSMKHYETGDEYLFKYKIGEKAVPDSFDTNPWRECSNGIHCFMDLKEAQEFKLV